MSTITKKELIDRIAERTQAKRVTVKSVIQAFLKRLDAFPLPFSVARLKKSGEGCIECPSLEKNHLGVRNGPRCSWVLVQEMLT